VAEPNQIQIMPDPEIYDRYMNNPGGMGFAPIGGFNPYGTDNVNTASDAFYNFGRSDPDGLGASILPITLAAGAGALATNLLGNSNGGGLGASGAKPWTSGLTAPAAPDAGGQLVKKAIDKFSDAGEMLNTVEAFAGNHLDVAMDLGGEALNNALQFASEYGTPGNVPGMADFGAELSGLKGDAAKSIVENFHPKSLADPIGEGLTSTYGSPAYEAAQASQLAGEGVSEAAATAISDATAAEAALSEAAVEFGITPKMLDSAGVAAELEALNLASFTTEASITAYGEMAGLAGTAAAPIVGAGGLYAGGLTMTGAGPMLVEMGGAGLGTFTGAAATTAVSGGAATATLGATMAAAAPLVIPALIMAFKQFGGKSNEGRLTWNSLFRVGEDNKIGHEIQGVSKFNADFAKLGEDWFIDVINNAIDAGGIVWDQSIIGPSNGKKLGDFGWQPEHGMKNVGGDLGSPWFINHADLPRGYKGENPGTYFESEHEAAKMWLYINAKAGHMKEGDLQKSFDAIDAFESLSIDRGYNDHGGLLEQRQGSVEEGSAWLEGPSKIVEAEGPDGPSSVSTMSEGYRQVASKSGLSDVTKKLTSEELNEEQSLMKAGKKWLQNNPKRQGNILSGSPIVIRETLNAYWVLQTHELQDVGGGQEVVELPGNGRITAVSKAGVYNEFGGQVGTPPNRDSLIFPKTYHKAAAQEAPKPAPTPKPTPPKPKPAPPPKPTPPKPKVAPPPPKPKPVIESKAKTGDVAKKASTGTGEYGGDEPTLYWSEPDEYGIRSKTTRKPGSWSYEDDFRKGGKLGKSKGSKKKIPASGLELPVTGGKAKPNSMTDDIPRTARSGDFVVNAKTVELMGVSFFRKLIRSALSKASTKGMKVSKTSVSKKEGVDIMVQNGEIRIPRELVKIIGLKKLRAWNNTGLRARGESPIAA
jgi:hypothetical protein